MRMKVLKLKKGKDGWEQDAQLNAADAAAAKALYKDDGKSSDAKYKLIGVDAANDAEYRKRGWLV